MILPIVNRAGAEVLLELDDDGIRHLRACLDTIDPHLDYSPPDTIEHGPEGSIIASHRAPWPRPGVIGAMAPALLIRHTKDTPDV
jgi:hypothetical protein